MNFFIVIVSVLLYTFVGSLTWHFSIRLNNDPVLAGLSAMFWPGALIVYFVALIIKIPGVMFRYWDSKNVGPQIVIEKGAEITSDSQYQTLAILMGRWERDTKRRII